MTVWISPDNFKSYYSEWTGLEISIAEERQVLNLGSISRLQVFFFPTFGFLYKLIDSVYI